MKNAFYFALLALFMLTTPACQKALFEDELIYVGAWSSNKYFIEIAANGFGFYQKRNNGLRDCRVKIRNNRIVFDWDGGRKSFRIDNPPSIELTTGRIYMTLMEGTFISISILDCCTGERLLDELNVNFFTLRLHMSKKILTFEV